MSLDLRQMLNLLPRLARLDGRPVEEVCAELELDRTQLFQLVQRASALTWGDHDEGELIDIWEDGGRLCVHTGGLFEQAVRLLPAELLALRLGAAQLVAAGLGRELQVERLLTRIEEGLAGGGPDVAERLRQQVGAQPDPALRPDVLEAVLTAHRERRVLRIWYYSRHSDRMRPRDVEAWRGVVAAGRDLRRAARAGPGGDLRLPGRRAAPGAGPHPRHLGPSGPGAALAGRARDGGGRLGAGSHL